MLQGGGGARGDEEKRSLFVVYVYKHPTASFQAFYDELIAFLKP